MILRIYYFSEKIMKTSFFFLFNTNFVFGLVKYLFFENILSIKF